MNLSNLLKIDRTEIDLRNNAFDFVRLILALIVVYSHAPYVGGFGGEPHLAVKDLYQGGITWGTVAMYGFFIISGFLITGSFVNSKTIWEYLEKRARRILPGLWACLFICAFIFAPAYYFLANGNLQDYWPNNVAFGYQYVSNNLTSEVMTRTVGNVLVKAPRNEMNGPIWSILFEIKAYLWLAVLGFLGFYKRKWLVIIPFLFFAINYYLVVFQPVLGGWFNLFFVDAKIAILFAYFFAGSLFFNFRDKIIWDWKVFVLMFLALLYAVQINLFAPIAVIAFTYCILFLCKVLPIRNLGRRLGDMSYGVYIYHWPIQQFFFFWGIHKINPYLSIYGSMLVSLLFGFLSFHLVEKRFMRRKS
jgi:peptidoglycan/LPS O-acetylase OafA/YrhL